MRKFVIYSPFYDAWSDVIVTKDEVEAISKLDDGGWIDDQDRELEIYELKTCEVYHRPNPSWIKKGK